MTLNMYAVQVSIALCERTYVLQMVTYMKIGLRYRLYSNDSVRGFKLEVLYQTTDL